MKNPDECQHEHFHVTAEIGRLSRVEGGPITHYCASIKCRCSQCGLEFEWCGVPPGLSAYEPRTSVDALELRIPIMPPGMEIPKGLPGFDIRHRPVGANDDG